MFLGLSKRDKKIILSHNGYSDIHCGKLFKESIKGFSGRGGGGPKQAQGTFEAEEDMMNFSELLKTGMGFNDRT